MISSKTKLAALFALWSTTALTPLAASAQDAAQNPRIALVIGNASYVDKALATTANDAGLVAQTLQAAGFEVIGARDLDEKSLRTALRDFLDKAAAAGPDMQAFVYLSGRAVQYNGDNYFVPVDAHINRDADVPIDAIRMSDFTHALAATPGKARIVVLDAARANPYATRGAPLAPGLALVDPEPGEMIAYNAAPGTLAGDEQGPYGVYGKTLAGAMRQGGVSVEDVFDQTRVQVNQQTQGALIPWSVSKLGAPYYIFERAADAPPPAAAAAIARTLSEPIASFPPAVAYNAALQRDTMQGYEEFLQAYPDSDQARRVRAILAARREAAFWRRSVNANTSHAYWTYVRRYSKGPHVADARRRLAILSARYEPPQDFQPDVYEDLPPPPPDEDFYEQRPYYAFDDFGPPPPPPPVYFVYIEDDDWRDLPPPPPPQEIGVLPVLGIAIPLAIGAIAYRNQFHDNGIAPVGMQPPPPPPFTPPPLPPNIKPLAPPPPALGGLTDSKPVKPLPPIGPAVAPVGVAPPVAGKPPVGLPVAPGDGKLPNGSPVAPVGVAPNNAATPPVAGKPPMGLPVVAPVGGKLLTGAPVAPVGVAPNNVVTPPVAGKPPMGLPVAPVGGKPPTGAPVAPVGVAPNNVATPPAAGKLPVGAPVAPGGKPLPVPAAPIVAPVPRTKLAPVQNLAPNTGLKPPIVAPVALPKAPMAPVAQPTAPVPAFHAPPPPAPVYHAPPQPAPVYHAPPQPAPVYHAPPQPAPVYHAPPQPAPVYHAPPQPAPVYHAPPQPAPVYRAPPQPAPALRPPAGPAPGRVPACGKPGLPPCG